MDCKTATSKLRMINKGNDMNSHDYIIPKKIINSIISNLSYSRTEFRLMLRLFVREDEQTHHP